MILFSACNSNEDEIFTQEIIIENETDLATRLAESNEFKNYSILKKEFSNAVVIEVLSSPEFSFDEFMKENNFSEEVYNS